MKGIVLDFSVQTNTGIISGEDTKRYHFTGSEWKETISPQRGQKVDYDINEQGQAVAIYFELKATSTFSTQTTEQSSKNEDEYNPFDWFAKGLKNYANFNGRARRKEFWFFNLGVVLCNMLAMILDAIFETEFLFYALVYLATVLPTLAVSSRRLHDIGKSGWWYLISLTIIGIFLLIYWWASEGSSNRNQYGEPAK